MIVYLVRIMEEESSHVDSVWSNEQAALERREFLAQTYFHGNTAGTVIEPHELDKTIDGGKIIYYGEKYQGDDKKLTRVHKYYVPLADYDPYYKLNEIRHYSPRKEVTFLADNDEEANRVVNEKLEGR